MSREADLEFGEDGESSGGYERVVPGMAGLPCPSPRQPCKFNSWFLGQQNQKTKKILTTCALKRPPCKVISHHFIFFYPPLQVMRSYFRRADPFFDEQENHSLIGVANVFLSCLFYDVKLQYAVPIINQKGEVGAHRLAG